LPVSISDADDTIPLTQLYRRLAPHTNQIVKWATGEEERSRNLITDDDIIDVYIHKEDNENFEMSVNIDNVIKGLNDVMVWAESSLTLDEILFLQRIREKAHNAKLSM